MFNRKYSGSQSIEQVSDSLPGLARLAEGVQEDGNNYVCIAEVPQQILPPCFLERLPYLLQFLPPLQSVQA